MRSWIAAAVLLALLGSAVPCRAQGGPDSGEKAPVLTVESDQLMLGNVTAGEDAIGTFILHNHGDKPINIIRAKPS